MKNNINILKELTQKFYQDKAKNIIMPAVRDMHLQALKSEGHYRKMFISNICQEIVSTLRVFADETKNLGRFNKKYDGIYIVPYSWLQKEISLKNYDKNIYNTYMKIVDECL